MIERGGFSVMTEKPVEHPWELLSAGGDPPSAFADADSVLWSLHSGLGKSYTITDGQGLPATVRFAGLTRGSIFAGEVLVSEETFRTLFPGVTAPRYFLVATPPGRAQAIAEVLRRHLGELGLEVRETREILNDFNRVQNTYLSVFLALGGLGVLLGTVGLLAVLLRNALERRREFALLLATGLRREHLVWLLLLENALLLVSGLLCGTLSALFAVAPHLVSAEAHVHWSSLFGVLSGILGVGLLSCAVAARTVARGNLLAALREE
jgi:ABC-type antimicrobial peptide transport system permease subunit